MAEKIGAIFTDGHRELSDKEKASLLPGALIIDLSKTYIIGVTTQIESSPDVDTYLVDLTKLDLQSEAAKLYMAFVTSAVRSSDRGIAINSHWNKKMEGWEQNAKPGLYPGFPCQLEALITLYYE